MTRIRAIQHTQRYYRVLNGTFARTHRNLFKGCAAEAWPHSLPPAWPFFPLERARALAAVGLAAAPLSLGGGPEVVARDPAGFRECAAAPRRTRLPDVVEAETGAAKSASAERQVEAPQPAAKVERYDDLD